MLERHFALANFHPKSFSIGHSSVGFTGDPRVGWSKAFILWVALGLIVTAQAGGVAGMTAFARGDYQAALAEWRPLAEQGEVEAQFDLGVLYDGGLGIKQDRTQAAHWYRQAAEQGHAKAQFNLAVLYANGLGVDKDMAEAVRWYQQAAARGQPEAQFNLAGLYQDGVGVFQNYATAAHWYQLAAFQGHAVAQNNLGILYASGQGIFQDLIAAYAWYDVAAANGNDKARLNRDQLAKTLTPAQISAGQQLSAKFAKLYQGRVED